MTERRRGQWEEREAEEKVRKIKVCDESVFLAAVWTRDKKLIEESESVTVPLVS